MAILENNNIWIKRCRLSFPAIVKPKSSVAGSALKYSCDAILEPDQAEWAEIKSMIAAIAKEKWVDKADGIMKMIKSDKRQRCYGNGDEKTDKDGVVYTGYEGNVFIGGNNDSQPQLMGNDAQPLPPTANLNELFAGGNYVSVIFNVWAQDNAYGKAIRGNLVAVQFLEKGEAFGATAIDATNVFQQVADAPAAAADPDPLG